MDFFQIFANEADFRFYYLFFLRLKNHHQRSFHLDPLSYYFKKVHVHDIDFTFSYFNYRKQNEVVQFILQIIYFSNYLYRRTFILIKHFALSYQLVHEWIKNFKHDRILCSDCFQHYYLIIGCFYFIYLQKYCKVTPGFVFFQYFKSTFINY